MEKSIVRGIDLGYLCYIWRERNLVNVIMEELNLSRNSFYNMWRRLRQKYRVFLIPNTKRMGLKLVEYSVDYRSSSDNIFFDLKNMTKVKLAYSFSWNIQVEKGAKVMDTFDIEGVYCFGDNLSMLIVPKKTKSVRLRKEQMIVVSHLTESFYTAKELQDMTGIPWQKISWDLIYLKRRNFLLSLALILRDRQNYITVKVGIEDIPSPDDIRPFVVEQPLILRSMKDDRLYLVFSTTISKLVEFLNKFAFSKSSNKIHIEAIYNKYFLPWITIKDVEAYYKGRNYPL
ncbi:MAG: hypothetical protein F7B61_04760 [Caldisphaeraceae archaeon]|nr:hypothetical protein [Caldisphaeraceae archaeon]